MSVVVTASSRLLSGVRYHEDQWFPNSSIVVKKNSESSKFQYSSEFNRRMEAANSDPLSIDAKGYRGEYEPELGTFRSAARKLAVPLLTKERLESAPTRLMKSWSNSLIRAHSWKATPTPKQAPVTRAGKRISETCPFPLMSDLGWSYKDKLGTWPDYLTATGSYRTKAWNIDLLAVVESLAPTLAAFHVAKSLNELQKIRVRVQNLTEQENIGQLPVDFKNTLGEFYPLVGRFSQGLVGKQPSLDAVRKAARIVRAALKFTLRPEFNVDEEDGDIEFDLRLKDGTLVMANLFPDGTIDASVYDDSQGIPVKRIKRWPSATADELVDLFESAAHASTS